MGKSNNATQTELAALFSRSQQWVSKRQTRTVDPMPRDLAGATEWGRRNGFLPGAVQASAPAAAIVPGGLPVNPVAVTGLDMADLALKQARVKKIQQEMGLKAGELISRDEIEEREIRAAAEFRVAACEYPSRARSVIERHVSDPAVVECIMTELQPLAADLLNRADPQKVLRGKSKDEIRAVLQAHVDELVASL